MNRSQLLSMIDRLIKHNNLVRDRVEKMVEANHGGKNISQLTKFELDKLYQYLLQNSKRKMVKQK